MPESVVARTKRDVTWSWTDAGAAHSYSPPIQVGDLSYEATLYSEVEIRNRGDLVHVRKGDEVRLKVSGTAILTDVGSSTYGTLPDLCEERGYIASTWTSTTAGESDVFTVDGTATVDGASFGEADKTMTFPDLVTRMSGASFGDPAQYAWTAQSATATKPTVA
jgi:hypothetical protein